MSNHWEGIKLGVTVVGFGACLVVSAGACMAVGVIGATISYGGDAMKTGKMDWAGYGKSLAWTVGGGAVAGVAARGMGAANWKGAFTGNAIERATVKIPAYRTKLGVGSGVGGGVKGWATQSAKVVDPGRTALNIGINSQLSLGLCGAGSASFATGHGC